MRRRGGARELRAGNTLTKPPKIDETGLLRMPLRRRVRSYVTDHADFDDFPLLDAVGNVQSAHTLSFHMYVYRPKLCRNWCLCLPPRMTLTQQLLSVSQIPGAKNEPNLSYR